MHKSVLLDECIENLNLKEDSVIVDATLGYAGHSSEILKRIPKGRLISFDQDDEAIKSSRERLSKIRDNFTIVRSNFKNMKSELNKLGIDKVDGILFDLGVSSPQLDEDYRGFSFHKDAKLDMRMDQTQDLSAYEVVNEYSKEDLVRIFRDYGEEKFALKIADKIVEYRKNKKIEGTLELVEIVKIAVPEKYKREKHPARKIFQAIRIEVNKELDVLKIALDDALTLIKKDGRICVITFHSLEDKIVKNKFTEVSKIDSAFKNLPFIPEEYQKEFKAFNVIKPSKEELLYNPRARSSKLRVIEKVK